MIHRWLLLTGVVLGILTVVLVNLYVSDVESRQVGVAFLRLAPDIEPIHQGQVLSDGMVTTEELPLRFEGLAELVVRDDPQSRAFVLGRPVNRDLSPGSPLLYDYFTDLQSDRFAAVIEPGKRAVAIPVGPASAVGFLIEPGSIVDVLGTFPRVQVIPAGEAAQTGGLIGLPVEVVTRTILQAVRVLAVDRAASRTSYLSLAERGFQSVTLEVTPEEAEILTFALGEAQGELVLSLRNPEDLARAQLRGIDWEQLP